MTTIKVGFMVNPVAGCGQLLNLRGSDSLPFSKCPRSVSAELARAFLEKLEPYDIMFLTASDAMGEDVFKSLGVNNYEVIYRYQSDPTAEDTVGYIRKLIDADVSVLIFFGGDGTARDIVDANFTSPVIAVPAGTKMFSSIFAISVKRAVQIFQDILSGRITGSHPADVIDLDENAYSEGRIDVRLYGELRVPSSDLIVSESKAEYTDNPIEGIAGYIVDNLVNDINYLVGPGSTCKSALNLLGIEGSLLGFDLLRNGILIKKDLSEQEIYELSMPVKIIISPIGGQGFLIGRGNKQLSSRVMDRVGFENLIVVAGEDKIRDLSGLYVDLPGLSSQIPAFVKILFGYGRFKMFPVFD